MAIQPNNRLSSFSDHELDVIEEKLIDYLNDIIDADLRDHEINDLHSEIQRELKHRAEQQRK
jgi:hypothetical protein